MEEKGNVKGKGAMNMKYEKSTRNNFEVEKVSFL